MHIHSSKSNQSFSFQTIQELERKVAEARRRLRETSARHDRRAEEERRRGERLLAAQSEERQVLERDTKYRSDEKLAQLAREVRYSAIETH